MMIQRLIRSGACVLALVGAPALAEETTWEVTGTLSFAGAAGQFPDDLNGSSYRLLVRFDNEPPPAAITETAVVCGTTASSCRLAASDETPTGAQYDISQPELQFSVYAGTSCQPCTFSSPSGGTLRVRDNFPQGGQLTDGISLFLEDPDDALGVAVIFRTTNLALNVVTGPQVPYAAPAILAELEISGFQAEDIPEYSAAVLGDTDAVSNPTYGVGYIFTARDCRIPARTDTYVDEHGNVQLVDPRPFDCVNAAANRRNGWSAPGAFATGGGIGLDGLSRIFNPSTSDIDASWGDGGTQHATAATNLGLTPVSMGTLFGDVSFGGPVAFPVLKGSTFAADSARINTNLFAYQRYSYSGGVTALPLVLALTYHISENSNDADASPSLVDRPGGAGLGASMSIVDGSAAVRLEAIRKAANNSFRSFSCGNEAALGLPAGSILGTADVNSAAGEQGSYAVTRTIESCANPGQQVTLQPNQGFIVVTGMQLPSRGKEPQPPREIAAPANGWVDSANTLRVTFDPQAPREVVQALTQAIEVACENCEFVPEDRTAAIDVRPGSTDGCINPGSNGVIPVAILGSGDFFVREVLTDDTLRLGSMQLRARGKSAGCSTTSVNEDAFPDLVCHFENVVDGWQSGQSRAVVSGKLVTGVAFSGTDNICLTK